MSIIPKEHTIAEGASSETQHIGEVICSILALTRCSLTARSIDLH